MIFCKTDYPLCREVRVFGPTPDESGKPAPMRDAVVLGWDGNKMATVMVQFENDDLGIYCFKIGYCYDPKLKKIPGSYKPVDTKLVHKLSIGREDCLQESFSKAIDAFNSAK